MIGLLAGAIVAQAALAGPATVSPVRFRSSSPREVFCRGVVLGEDVVTARHCVEQAASRSGVVIEGLSPPRLLSSEDVQRLVEGGFSSKSASFPNDYNVFSISGDNRPTPVSSIEAYFNARNVGEPIAIGDVGGSLSKCVIRAVCGSNFFYSCGRPTRPGWSGSPIYSRNGSRTLVGIHTNEGTRYGRLRLHQGTTIQSIVGRSSALFESSDQYGDEVARTAKFAHHRSAICARIDPQVSGSSPLENRELSSGRLIHALATLDANTVLAADISPRAPAMCIAERRYGWAQWRCRPSSYIFANRVNTLEPLGGNSIAIGESEIRLADRSFYNPSVASAGVTLARLLRSEDGPRLMPSRRVLSTVGSVYAVRRVGPDLLVGGERGVCVIGDTDDCTPICAQMPCGSPGGSDEWRVNGVLALTDRKAVAVGRDYAGTSPFPTIKWYSRTETGWRQLAGTPDPRELIALATNVRNRTGGMQFKAPLLIGSTLIVFGSDGGAYVAEPNKTPRKIPIRNLWRVSRTDNREGVLEEAVRDAVILPDGDIGIASSDGATHILRPIFDGASLSTLQGDQALTVFDQGVMTTQIVAAGADLLVRTQDGAVDLVRRR